MGMTHLIDENCWQKLKTETLKHYNKDPVLFSLMALGIRPNLLIFKEHGMLANTSTIIEHPINF